MMYTLSRTNIYNEVLHQHNARRDNKITLMVRYRLDGRNMKLIKIHLMNFKVLEYNSTTILINTLESMKYK